VEDLPRHASHDPASAVRPVALDAIVQGVVVVDARRHDCPAVEVNDGFLRLTGYGRGEVIGRNCRFLQGPGTDVRELERLRTALRADEPYFGELLNYRRDGTAFWNALSLVPLHDEDGVTSHWIGTQTDLTSIRRRDLLDGQHARVVLLDAFGRAIAHDMNNVLLAASGYAELLAARLAGPEREQLQGYAQQIVSAAETGRVLTQQLLGFSRGVVAPDDPVDVVEVAAATTALVAGLLPARVELRTELPREPVCVRGDRSQVAQVLMNLLVNARDAIEPPGEIVVRVKADGATARLAVSDTGTVLSPEVRARLFDAFFTVADGGNGLGMLMTTTIVRRLGGRVETQAAPGGTTVEVALPRLER
jgi:PAS domain S-box-containing protein